jgi:hypothetical protein
MLGEIFLLFLVGILWGGTNYLIELTYHDIENIQTNEAGGFNKLKQFLLKNIKALLFFILNQSGSILFYFCLGKISMSN